MSAKALRSAAELARAGLVPEESVPALAAVAARYAVALTPAMAALIDASDPDDPIARQFIPDPAELALLPEERADPIGDLVHSPIEGIVHRYPDRVLLKAVHVCPVYCRFCFRRETVGPAGLGTLPDAALDAALAYIAARPAIWEVILTGGDPLVLAPRRLARIMSGLQAIAHVKVVRLHSRVPAVEPECIDAPLVRALKSSGKAVYVALHANHPRELTPPARAACGRLIDAGIPMLSQTVLLKGVNDSPAVLEALMRAFVETRIRPYYLHHPDLAPGTARFRLAPAEGQALLREMRGRVSGLCQPSYVLDIPGGHGKAPIGPCALEVDGSGVDRVQDYRGQWHAYPLDEGGGPARVEDPAPDRGSP